MLRPTAVTSIALWITLVLSACSDDTAQQDLGESSKKPSDAGGISPEEDPLSSGGADPSNSVSSGGQNDASGGEAAEDTGTRSGGAASENDGSGGDGSSDNGDDDADNGTGGDGSGSGGSDGTGGKEAANAWSTIRNGGYRNDTDDKRIEAHGGGFLKQGDTWYWIGEDKEHNGATFQAVNCYSSTDLEHWSFENAIITRETASELDTSDRIIERPKLVYNESTSRYVMWLHWEGQNYADAEAGVFFSETVCGDYSYHKDFRPYSNMSRDDTLFIDDDGAGYFISAANENRDLIVYELTEDYLDVQRQVITLWESSWREAPALFKTEGTYFLVSSGATGWDPNQAQYSYASSMDGPWAELRNLGDGTTFDTQPTYIIPVEGTEMTTFIYTGDRWQDPDLQSSKYIWLPLEVDGTNLTLNYYDEWRINVLTGEWTTDDEFINQKNWTLLSVDSEETNDEDGAAENAFDDSPSTIWHTGYSNSTPEHPHVLEIDLGASYLIDAMRHLPRQDADENGIIAEYELYISESADDWGDSVVGGSFSNDENNRAATLVEFAPKAGRYIRFIALSNYEGNAFTSLAELDLREAVQ